MFGNNLSSQIKNAVKAGHQDTMLDLTHKGLKVPIRIRFGNTNTNAVVFWFHGAADRNKRSLPIFVDPMSELNFVAHQVSICDPSLYLSDDVRICWYSGGSGLDVQSKLSDFLVKVSEVLGATRRVYTGTSGGGFAALLYSWHDAESIVVAGNPQTVIQNYYPRLVKQYIECCWKGKQTSASLPGSLTTSLPDLYATNVPNTVLYFQNTTDIHHLNNHFSPFAQACTGQLAERVHFELGYWGTSGHKPPTKEVFLSWLEAACCADTVELKAITDAAYGRLNALGQTSNAKNHSPTTDPNGSFAVSDIEISDAISKMSMS